MSEAIPEVLSEPKASFDALPYDEGVIASRVLEVRPMALVRWVMPGSSPQKRAPLILSMRGMFAMLSLAR